MDETFQACVEGVDRTRLLPLVRKVLDDPQAEVLTWQAVPLGGGLGHHAAGGLGIYRFCGQARVRDREKPWSLVLKAASGATATSIHDPIKEQYWRRELCAYQCGLLAQLPGGLAAPRCYDVDIYPEEHWLWIENVEESQKVWPLARFQLAARHLARFNAYFDESSLPNDPWLYRGNIWNWPESQTHVLRDLHRLAQQPQSWLSQANVKRILRLYEERWRFWAMLHRLPRCLCHHDANRRNLIARRTPSGLEETVVIDWAQLGIGVLGEEPATLTYMSLGCLDVAEGDPAQLNEMVFAGYMDGLADVGWRGDEREVRFAYVTVSALVMGVGGLVRFLPVLADEAFRTWAETSFHHPLQVILERWGELHEFLLDLGDEARHLLNQLE